jgi:hypothetical protein
MPAYGHRRPQEPLAAPQSAADPAPCRRRRHLAHDTARNAGFFVGIVNAAKMVIFSVA